MNFKSLSISFLVLTTLISLPSFAKTTTIVKSSESNPYFEIKKVSIKEISSLEMMNSNLNSNEDKDVEALDYLMPEIGSRNVLGGLDNVILVIDKLLAIGQKITPIIEKGRPVVNANPMAPISVLPKIETTDSIWSDMAGWSVPTTRHYKITYTNGFNSVVVSFVYSVTFQWGGSYKGVGQYLTGVRATARDISVSWGFDLDASSTLIQISNMGSGQFPIAGATVEISYSVKNMLKVLITREAFHVTGDGKIFKLD